MKLNELRRLIISKRLNILLGSGCSLPAIPLMSNFKSEDYSEEEANSNLEEKIKEVSKILSSDAITIDSDIGGTLLIYISFIQQLVKSLNLSNSRETPRRVNIFTTNYDLFIEKAFDKVTRNYKFVINDGATGYFNRLLESSNFDQVVSYKGINDNYISEIPSISLIKPHRSVNWEKDEKGEYIYVRNNVVEHPVIVKPTGFESNDTFNQNHFFSMLRFFTNELDKPQSVLMVIGFSFQDKHIAKMVKRAIANPELLVICFCYEKDNVSNILENLGYDSQTEVPANLQFIIPKSKIINNNECSLPVGNITLEVVVRFMNGDFDEGND